MILFRRQVEAQYPHFPADTAALYSALSLPDVRAQSRDKLVVLSKFISKQSEVEGTLPFLTDFMEFYQWLHKDLAGLLTPEKADKLSIKKLVDQMSRHYSGESGRKMMSLYQRVKCKCMVDAKLFAVMVFIRYIRWLQSLCEGCSWHDT